jgi:hypothetical protein
MEQHAGVRRQELLTIWVELMFLGQGKISIFSI